MQPPKMVDMTVQDAYRALMFQMIFWRRQTEKAALARTLVLAANDDSDANDAYRSYLNVLYSGAPTEKRGLSSEKVKEIMEEESKKAYIVTPVSGLSLRRGMKRR